jgi:hypothetical protein
MAIDVLSASRIGDGAERSSSSPVPLAAEVVGFSIVKDIASFAATLD